MVRKKFNILKRKSKYALMKERQRKKSETAGKRFFHMKAPELTEEVKNDLKLLKYSQVLTNNTFMKNNDRRGHAKHFQIGTVMDSATDFYSNR